MTFTPTPRAIGFPEPEVPMGHVPDWRLFDETTLRVVCLRCRVMVNVRQWASDVCPGEPTNHESPAPSDAARRTPSAPAGVDAAVGAPGDIPQGEPA